MVCGVEGKPACESTSATFVRGVPTHDACRDGGFVDPINGGECWKCPDGYVRSWRPVTDKKAACIKPRNGLAFQPAITIETNMGKCPSGQFFDPRNGGECWSCPQGYNRSLAEVDKFNACAKPAYEDFSKATHRSSLKTSCPSGQFSDPNGGCYSCPSGYNRTAHAVTSNKACSRLVESNKHAINKGRGRGLLGTDCSSGEFWDPNGNCYTCPSGHGRTAAAVTASNACHRSYEDLKSANSHGKLVTSCPRGQFGDPNGKCYTCPSGFKRTGYAVTSDRACSKVVNEQLSRATQERRLCRAEEGEFVDLGRCWQCPPGYDRALTPVNSEIACVTNAAQVAAAEFLEPWGCNADKGEFWDLKNKNGSKLGTCWKCPTQYERGTAAVDSNQACISSEVRWENDPYDEPGLFGIGGNRSPYPALVASLLESPEKIAVMNDVFYLMWDGMEDKSGTADDFVRDQWKLIASNPATSPALKAFVYQSLQQVLLTPKGERSRDEQALVDTFADYVYKRRLYISEQAMVAYEAWENAVAWRGGAGQGTNLANLGGVAIPPPDFLKIAEESLHGSAGSGIVLVSLAAFNTTLSNMPTQALAQIGDNIFPYMGRGIAKRMARGVADKALRQAALTAAKASSTIVRSVGPQVVFAIFTIVTEVRMNQVIEAANARPKLQESLDYATRNSIDLEAMQDTEEGQQMMLKYWSLATDSEQRPANSLVSIAKKAAAIARESGYAREYSEEEKTTPIVIGESISLEGSTSSSSSGKAQDSFSLLSWEKLDSNAIDVITNASNDLYKLSANGKTTDLYQYNERSKKWQNIAEDVLDATAAKGDQLWLMDRAGKLYSVSADGSNRKNITGGASSITSTNDGDLWVVSDKLSSQGGEIWRLDGSKWQKKQGLKAVSIAMQDGYLWAVTKQGDIYRSETNDDKKILRSKMTKLPGKAQDISSSADGSVWVVGSDDQIYQWVNENWVKMPGNATALKIASASKHSVWIVNKQKQLLLGTFK